MHRLVVHKGAWDCLDPTEERFDRFVLCEIRSGKVRLDWVRTDVQFVNCERGWRDFDGNNCLYANCGTFFFVKDVSAVKFTSYMFNNYSNFINWILQCAVYEVDEM